MSYPEPTDEMLKRLRSAHGGALDASKLSDQEKVAINSESRLLTKQEKRNFKNFCTKQMFEPSTIDFNQAIENQLKCLREKKPLFDQ